MANAAQRSPLMRRAVKYGLIGGAVTLYCSVIGLFQTFQVRELVTGVISLGRALLLIIAFTFGYLASKRRRDPGGTLEEHAPGAAVLAGVTAGAITGAISALFMLLASTGKLQSMLVLVTDRLVEVLSFGAGAGTGTVILLLVGAVTGGLGAASTLLAEDVRKLVFTTLFVVILVSLGEALLNTFFTNLFFETYLSSIFKTEWVFSGGALTIFGAILVAALVVVGKTFGRGRFAAARARMESAPRERQRITRSIALMLLIGALLYVPQLLGLFMSEVVGTVGVFILLGLGLNIVVGYAGLLDLGYVAFFAIAAYATAILTSPQIGNFEMSFWTALPIVVVISTIGGILIGAPVLRLRGDYLAIVTLGFGEIIRIVAISNWAKPLTGGAQGIRQIPDIVVAGTELDDPQKLYYVILAICLLAAFISLRLQGSRVGRAWNAMREDESVAEAMGISIIKYKLLAFATGAAIASLGGAFFATKIGSVFPLSFGLLVSIQALALIVLGGMGSIAGVIVGALVLVGLPELLREFGEYRLLFYGAILVAIMVTKPEGLLPSARRRAELHVEEVPEVQYEKRAGEESGAPVVTAGAGD